MTTYMGIVCGWKGRSSSRQYIPQNQKYLLPDCLEFVSRRLYKRSWGLKAALSYGPPRSCGNVQEGLVPLNQRKHTSVDFYKPVHFSHLYTACIIL